MKCEECLKVIEEYFDGELREPEVSLVQAHIARCYDCARHLEGLKGEQNLYALYRRDLEVTPALWAGVEARIRDKERAAGRQSRWLAQLSALFGTPRLSPVVALALVIVAVGLTAGVMSYMQSRADSAAGPQVVSQKQAEASAPSTVQKTNNADERKEDDRTNEAGNTQFAGPKENDKSKAADVLTVADRATTKRPLNEAEYSTGEETPERLVREAEQKYQAAITLLARDAKRRRPLLEADVRDRFDQTLAVVDRTITETRRAARRQPLDPVAVQYMLAAYAKKVEVLKEMATYRSYDRGMQ